MRSVKTKIVCTIGPACEERRDIAGLIEAGMNVARLNTSHNTLAWHEKTIRLIRSLDPSIPILLDIPGRKLRTVVMEEPRMFKKGETVVFTGLIMPGDKKIGVDYIEFHKDLSIGDTILADDSLLRFEVSAIKGRDVHCIAMVGGVLGSRKGINVPQVRLRTPLVTKRDVEIIRFAKRIKVDLIGVSFVESARHVQKINGLLGNSGIEIISKIENSSGLEQMSEIIEESFGVMIDRGDLGAETGVAGIGMVQKEIIRAAAEHARPVIVATEMLHSMILSPRPTKAEVMDITNAVLDGASAVMLSGETAIGANPALAVSTMREVASEVERSQPAGHEPKYSTARATIPGSIAHSIHEICRHLPVTKVVCVTLSGYAARMIAGYNLRQPIIAVTNSQMRARQFNLLRGVTALSLNVKFESKNVSHILASAKLLFERGMLAEKDLAILTAVKYPHKGNRMNYLEIHEIGDLVRLFGWKSK